MKKFIKRLIMALAISICIYSSLHLASIILEYQKIDKMDRDLIKKVVSNSSNKALTRKINWTLLSSINPDVIGWIYIPGTRIDYPIMKSDETYPYLKLNYMKQKSISGSIFTDFRNGSKFKDSNTIIYGHNMKNGSMFSDLRNFVDQKYMDNHINVYIYLPDGTVNVYRCFSCLYTKATSQIYQTSVNYQKYVPYVINGAMAKENVDTVKKAPLVTLSTCTMAHSEKRTVVFSRYITKYIPASVRKKQEAAKEAAKKKRTLLALRKAKAKQAQKSSTQTSSTNTRKNTR